MDGFRRRRMTQLAPSDDGSSVLPRLCTVARAAFSAPLLLFLQQSTSGTSHFGWLEKSTMHGTWDLFGRSPPQVAFFRSSSSASRCLASFFARRRMMRKSRLGQRVPQRRMVKDHLRSTTTSPRDHRNTYLVPLSNDLLKVMLIKEPVL